MADTRTNNDELILSLGSLKECVPLHGSDRELKTQSSHTTKDSSGKTERMDSMEVSPRKLDRYVSGSWIVYDASTQSLEEWLAETRPSEVMNEEKGVECIAVHSPGEELPVHSFQKEEYVKYLNLVTETLKKPQPVELQPDELHPLDYAKKCCEKGIRSVAQKQRYTTGYWHLYETVANIDRVWARVARATHEGKLGVFAKVLLPSGQVKGLHMHVYAKDFTNEGEVKEVLEAILDMGLVVRNTMDIPAYFKPDVYLSLGITCKNPWKLKPALYKEMLHELTGTQDLPKNTIKKKKLKDDTTKKENSPIQVIQENHRGAVFGAKDIRIRRSHVKENSGGGDVHLTPAGMNKKEGLWKRDPLKQTSGHHQRNKTTADHATFNKNKQDNSFSIGRLLSAGNRNKHNRRSLDSNTSKPDPTPECTSSRLNRSFGASSACGSSGEDSSTTILFCYPIGQTGKDVIRSLFSEHGQVVDLQVKHERGFAFVHMADAYQAFQASMALNGFSLNGQTLQVSVKESK